MNQINVTIELCAEDRARLDNILAALAKATAPTTLHSGVVEQMAQNLSQSEKETAFFGEPKQEAPAEPEPEKAAPAKQEEPKPAQPEAAPEVSAAELQSKVVQLVGKGKKDAARAIVMEYAPNVGSIPAEKRAEVLARLNALEG